MGPNALGLPMVIGEESKSIHEKRRLYSTAQS